MRRSRPLTLLRLSLLLAVSLPVTLAAQGPASGSREAQKPDTAPFAETIEVREVEVRVDLSALPAFESIGKKGREDFIVVEDGVDYPLTELAAAPADWIFVLYFDTTLADPNARYRAAIELAGQAERLVAGGLAEIVVADPQPHTVVTTGSADALRRQLDELALAAAREAELRSNVPAATFAAATAARLAQLDRLSVEIAARGGGGARGLLLPVGSWTLDPEALARLTQSNVGTAADLSEFQPLRDTARVLAGYGWVTVPLALRPVSDTPEPSAAERRTQVSVGGGGDRRTTVPIVSISGKEEPADPATAAQVATLTDFSLMPWSELARASSGALIGETGRLRETLAQLLRRRQFTYRSPFPQPGRLLALEVRWKGGDGRVLAAPRWLRSSIPPEAAAARLRRLLAGDAPPESAKTGGIQWNAEKGEICFPGEGDQHWVRLSSATERDGQIQIAAGQPMKLERIATGFCVDAPPAGAGRTVRLAEDLENETWTGAVSAPN